MTSLKDNLTYQPNELAFGTSGLRGLVTDMTDLECYINTTGFLNYLQDVDDLAAGQSVYLAGDLRHSTPRIVQAVARAIEDHGQTVVYCGFIPTPSLAFYGLQQQSPSIMVTGSHIPDDRNGIKFYKRNGEVLKEDEQGIKAAVAAVRQTLYGTEADRSPFAADGMSKVAAKEYEVDAQADQLYAKRYQDVFGQLFAGKKIVFYQHSAVGRDSLAALFESLGAEVVREGRSEKFIPIDTENVTPDDQAYFKTLAAKHLDAFAIVSTDGDSDRPFVIDEQGIFHRGDVLGAVVADWLKADFAALPVSSSDATDRYLDMKNITWQHTKIGSPYVIAAMNQAKTTGNERVVGWEVNGGFLLGGDIEVNGKTLKALPTRDAFFPIAAALALAIEKDLMVSELFATLPKRATQAGLINNFPPEISRAILDKFAEDTPETRAELVEYFTPEKGFSMVTSINSLDGIRIFFDNGEIAHMRPSGNAPQLRLYSVADTQERADEMVALALAEPDGIFRQLEKKMSA